ncbi:kelch domain-containing protein 2-like [Oscarella lobularis]|uniref:kelch domain-containing protein 2-like n=1 Tax=Oscarella lobularis TaxID=121494 RepID=UPI0033134A00
MSYEFSPLPTTPTAVQAAQGRLGHFSVCTGPNVIVGSGSGEMLWCSRMKLSVYNTLTGHWKLLETSGYNEFEFVSGSCAAIVAGSLFCFGGFDRTFGRIDPMIELDFKTLKWSLVETTGRQPTPRDKLCCWVYGLNVYFFGGFGPRGIMKAEFKVMDDGYNGWNNGLYLFNTETKEWTELEPTMATPCPRAAHAVAQLGAKAYVFGGRYEENRMNDLHCFDCETSQWLGRIDSVGERPEGRSWHSFTPVSSELIFLHGGINTQSEILSDSWLFNVKSTTWTRVDDPPGCATRMWHTGCGRADGEVFLFGGSSKCVFEEQETSIHGNRMMIFRVTPRSLLRICTEYVASVPDKFAEKLPFLPLQLQKLIQTVCR